ncbi:polysaccharide biosynthesis C-terminal domain-containing protein [Clostridioides difficile]|nr:polysaccharide biosynthesis C-terminal domain-containing protein [Clostridioides difficile]
MDFLNGKLKPIYLKYLCAAFGSAMITSVYSIVDMAIVGKYQGAEGTAALAVVAPIWNVIYSLGLLTGIGGSVIFNIIRGQSTDKKGTENQYFTISLFASFALAVLAWSIILFYEQPILRFGGADNKLLVLAIEYLAPIKWVFPVFLLNQMLAAFLRNDKNPALATVGVLCGGVFNMAGDYVFVFTFDMGIKGAGLATAIGACIPCAIMLLHFVSKRNTLRIVRPTEIFFKLRKILVTGFPTFFVDVAMGILTILFNRQIMKYLGANALAVYGLIVNISTFVQCCAYSVGQAAQPIISMNFGAAKGVRIKEMLRYALVTVFAFSVFWSVLSLACPNLYVYLFMKPGTDILQIAPAIIRTYSISFILLPFNIFSTYYFQAILKPVAALTVSVARGLVISSILILTIPAFVRPELIWYSMPITELIVAFYAVNRMIVYTKQLPSKRI